MINRKFLAGVVLTLLFSIGSGKLAFAATPELVSWTSDESQTRFQRSRHKVDFFPLSIHFENQTNRIFCGPTSAAIVLNAFRADQLRSGKITLTPDQSLLAEKDRKYLNPENTYVFNRYTQNNIFDVSYREAAGPVKSKLQVLGEPMGEEKKADWGFQLRHLGELLSAHGLKVQTRVVSDDFSSDQVRKELTKNLKEKNNFVLVNYARKSLGQAGGGHISPIGAYDKKSDSFLVMDVNPNTDNWVWVKAEDLIAAMRTFDTVENRGYLLVEEGR